MPTYNGTSDIPQFNLKPGQQAERKLLVTIAEWEEPYGSSTVTCREILGTRTPDSSIDYNADIETETDIRGNNYTDVTRTQPQQDLDPYKILGGSRLGAFLNQIRRRNDLSELNAFTVYVVTMYTGTEGQYETEKHDDCTITYTSVGGDTRVSMPISVYLSNKITLGTIDKIAEDFTFTPDAG